MVTLYGYHGGTTVVLNVTRVSSLLPTDQQLSFIPIFYLLFITVSLLLFFVPPILIFAYIFRFVTGLTSVVSTHPTESELLLYPSYFLFTYPTITDLPTYNRLVLLLTISVVSVEIPASKCDSSQRRRSSPRHMYVIWKKRANRQEFI
jgi:hypothetical protein